MPPRDALTRSLDAIVDGAIVAFALFTVAYHVAIVAGIGINATATVWVAATVVALVGLRFVSRARREIVVDDVDVEPVARAALVALALGALVAVVLAASVLEGARWWLADLGAVIALLLGGAAVWRGRDVAPTPREHTWVSAAAVALAVAVVFAGLALFTVRPDADDVLLVNRSVWIERRGPDFPARDTLFSNERFAYTRPENPSPAIEPFIGVVARATPFTSPTVAYLLLAPVVSFLAMLALWQLLRELRAELPWLALLVAAVFLAFGANVHTTFGNFAFGRAWQGKVIFVFLAVPLLWRHALAWGRSRDARSGVMLVATNVAAVGFSTTALFIAPAVTVLGVLAGVLPDWWGGGARDARATAVRVAGTAAALVYPVGGALFALRAARQPTSVALAAGRAGGFVAQIAPRVDIAKLDAWDPWYTVIGTGVIGAVAGVAVLIAWWTTRERVARVALALAPLSLFGVFVLPPVLHALQSSSDSGDSVLWRVVWVVPVPAMVGLAATGVLARLANRAATVVAAVAVAALCIAAGTPVWAHENGARFSLRPQWDLAAGDSRAAARLLGMTHAGDVVAAPESVAGAIAVQSVDVRTVDPRGKYMTGRHTHNRFFHPNERRLVTRGTMNGIDASEAGAFIGSLRLLSVDAVCTTPGLERGVVGTSLRRAGFVDVGRDAECHYWQHERR